MLISGLFLRRLGRLAAPLAALVVVALVTALSGWEAPAQTISGIGPAISKDYGLRETQFVDSGHEVHRGHVRCILCERASCAGHDIVAPPAMTDVVLSAARHQGIGTDAGTPAWISRSEAYSLPSLPIPFESRGPPSNV